jgi:hypothetical protein
VRIVMPAAGDNEPAACYLEVLALTPRLGKAFLDLRHNNFFSVRAGAERMIADCPPSALVGQIRQIEEGSVSGSS